MSQLQPPQWAPSQPPGNAWNNAPQMPLYQPPYQPPVKPGRKSHKLRNILLACLAVVLIAAIALTVIVLRGSSSADATIGDVVTAGTWNVSVNSVTSNRGNGSLNAPQAGDVYLVIDITLKNTATTSQKSSTLGQWKLSDAQEHIYDEDIFYSARSPEGSVAPGQQVHGPIAYEVPQNIHSYTLQFMPNAGDTADLVQWNLSI